MNVRHKVYFCLHESRGKEKERVIVGRKQKAVLVPITETEKGERFFVSRRRGVLCLSPCGWFVVRRIHLIYPSLYIMHVCVTLPPTLCLAFYVPSYNLKQQVLQCRGNEKAYVYRVSATLSFCGPTVPLRQGHNTHRGTQLKG